MITPIYNSSHKQTGQTEISEHEIKIDNIGKPILIITDPNILLESTTHEPTDETLIKLYNDYTLSISEIASIYNRCYSNINKRLKKIDQIEFNRKGRRNRAYGHPVSPEQSQKMSTSLKGRTAPIYERTPEIRKKISNSLKAYFSQHPQDPTPHILNWKQGVYDNADFKIGIAGHFTSIKMQTTIRFRSLLELFFLLKIENDPLVTSYKYEPFHIDMDNGKSYMPDFLINNSRIVELKSKKYVERVKGVKEKVLYKQSQAHNFCAKNGLTYEIIYDEDIDFDSRRMKAYIKNNPDIVKKYDISFVDPKRMV